MNTYVTNFWVGNNTDDVSPIASSLFGVCDDRTTAPTKFVKCPKFDRVANGVTIFVKFANGNVTSNNLKLQVGNTSAYPIAGDCTCGADEIIAFTFEYVDSTHQYWHANTAGISSSLRQYVENLIDTTVATPDILIFKGTIGTGGNPGVLPSSGYSKGWLYYISSNGRYLNTSCEAGDIILAISDAADNQTTINPAHWTFIQHKKEKIVTGPDNSINGHVAIFAGSSGTIIQDSGFTLGASVPANAVFTDTKYQAGLGLELNEDNNTFYVKFGQTADSVCRGNDPRLTDPRTPTAHNHGNITNDGFLGNTSTNALVIVKNGEIEVGPLFKTNGTEFLKSTGEWAALPDPPVTSVNGQTGDVLLDIPTLPELDLTAMHFIGIATKSIEEDGFPGIDGYTTAKPGDVVLGATNHREYIYTSNNAWEMLGAPFSTIREYEADGPNKWISKLYQNTNGEVHSVEFSALDTSGTWTGIANKANQFTAPQTVYVNLALQSITTQIQGGSTDPHVLGINGILGIQNGGTGVSAFNSNEVIISNNTNGTTTQLTSRAYLDSESATALSNSSNFVTERRIYYGLPTINNTHNYTSNTQIYAPTTSGSQYALLVSDGTGAPMWTGAATLNSQVSTTESTSYTSLTLGNNKTNTTVGNSAGRLYLYSSSSGWHRIDGESTTNNYIHTLPAATGTFVQMTGSGVGSSTQPVYVSSSGTITALQYELNRIYASIQSTDAFVATSHYINNTQMTIGASTAPDTNDTLKVSGHSTFNGIIHITNDTDVTNDSNGALIVEGGTSIGKNLEVQGITYLSDNTGIGQPPDSTANNYILAVTGNTSLNGRLDINGKIFIKDTTAATTSDGALVVDGGISVGKNLYVNKTSVLLESVGIGTSDTQLEYILTINGNIRFLSNATEVATFITQSIQNVLQPIFAPTNNDTGSIGTSAKQWKDAYFSHLLQVGNKITLSADGSITISDDNPTITLTSVGQNTSYSWSLENSNGTLTLNNLTNSNITTTSLIANDNGFGVKPRLYINRDIPTNNSNLVQLFVQGNSLLNGVVGIGMDATSSLSQGYTLVVSGASHLLGNVLIGHGGNTTISYQGSKSTSTMFSFLDNTTNTNGNGLIIGGHGGLVVVGAGESGNLTNISAMNGYSPSSENLYLFADGTINIESNANTFANRIGVQITTAGHLIPIAAEAAHTAAQNLGSSSARWAKLYIGNNDTYGDPYLPIYWHDGAPTYGNGVVQKQDFTFKSGSTSCVLEHAAYNQLYGIETFVLQIVVTSGEQYLTDQINWTTQQKENSTTLGQVILTTTAVTGTVSGYILTARGKVLD